MKIVQTKQFENFLNKRKRYCWNNKESKNKIKALKTISVLDFIIQYEEYFTHFWHSVVCFTCIKALEFNNFPNWNDFIWPEYLECFISEVCPSQCTG